MSGDDAVTEFQEGLIRFRNNGGGGNSNGNNQGTNNVYVIVVLHSVV